MKRLILLLSIVLACLYSQAQAPISRPVIRGTEYLQTDTVKSINGASISVDNNRMTNLADPVNPQDAVTLKMLQDSTAGTSTDNQTLSIDSVARLFTISITGGNSVSFEDLDTPPTGSESVFDSWDKNAADDFSGVYDDLTGKPTIPTDNSQLLNGAGYIASESQTLSIDSVGRAFTISITGGNSVSFEDLGGTGADDQTASEVPVVDVGNYFAGADVESVLQELGSSVETNNAIPFLSDKTISPTPDLSDYLPIDGSRKYSMMPRIAINPVTGVMTMVFRFGYDHVGNHDNGIVIRRSLDYGKTWQYIGGAGISYIIDNAGSDDRNPAIFYTPSGRLMLFYGVYISGVWQKSKYRYSDDDGTTWSADVEITHGITGANQSMQVYSNRCFVDSNGYMYYPWYSFVTSPSYFTRLHLARSTDNGVTWNVTYKTVYDGQTGLGVVTEPVAVDLGGGNWSLVCRTGKANTSGHIVPVILISNDQGETWGGGTWGTIGADKNSDFMYLNGDGVTMAASTNSLDQTLPDACVIQLGNEPFLVITYWIRRDGLGNSFQLRRHLLPVREVLNKGFSASLKNINHLVYDSPYKYHNGGNGSSIALDASILHVFAEQMTSSTSGGQEQFKTFVFSEEELNKQFYDTQYNNALELVAGTNTFDLTKSVKASVSLTANTVIAVHNLEVGGSGSIIVTRDSSASSFLVNFYSDDGVTSLTTTTIGSNTGVSSASFSSSLVVFSRYGNNVIVTYGHDNTI